MFSHIYVPVDNSEHSNAAVDLALELGRAFGSRLTGCHVFAGRLHDMRFRQLESTLPEEYRQEAELERQRRIHESLIAMGLRLISDSYLDAMERKSKSAGLAFERRSLDGRHHAALLDDVRASDCDVVVMGALGMGAVKDSQLGSVTQRFVRKTPRDTLVVKTLDPASVRDGAIVVGLDGSAQSFNALRFGVALGKTLGRPVEAVAAYDPYLHYALFKSIAGVLSTEAARVFRFSEQERLHEEIIDAGLARVYQSHLEIGRRLAREQGVELDITLLQGKCFEKVLHHCRASLPWLLVLGRAGVHSDEAETELGSNSENLLRLAPCNVLLTGGRFHPPLDVKAEETVTWTAEAQARMERVPPQVKGVARAAVLRWAVEQGHTVITSSVIDEAMALFMPGRVAERMRAVAREVAAAVISTGAARATAICSGCGYAARGPRAPARCPVCGGERFTIVDRADAEALAAREGGADEEEALPGVTVRWTAEARAALGEVSEPPLRRQAQARVEKQSRSRRIPVITRDVALPMIEETVGRDRGRASAIPWTREAAARLERVPAGFMRDMTRDDIETVARERGAASVDLALCEERIAHLRTTMCGAAAHRPAGRPGPWKGGEVRDRA